MQKSTRWRLGLLLGLFVAGCSTPLEQCIWSAGTEVRYIEEELSERRMNIARGYAIRRDVTTELVPEICLTPLEGIRYTCWEPMQTVRETRRPINVGDEQERIAQLERALVRDRRVMEQAVAQCRAQYPQG